jgi:hypothetical protein
MQQFGDLLLGQQFVDGHRNPLSSNADAFGAVVRIVAV